MGWGKLWPLGRNGYFPFSRIPLAIEPATIMVRLYVNASRDVRDQATNIIDMSAFRRPYVGNAASPFRYPGGKGFLTPLLSAEIAKRFDGSPPSFAEPYCGGAGAATNLLLAGEVEQLFLNDADRRIYSAWRAMVNETERFLEKISSVQVNLTTWDNALIRLHETSLQDYDFELGFAAFFVNRTSRSGVILGSGPIGGYSQEGRWKIDARFNKEALAKRVRALGELRDQIILSCQDGLEFCQSLAHQQKLSNTFLFIDPPYVGAGGRLYYDGMNEARHRDLANWISAGSAPHWLLTYDDHPLVRENYSQIEQNLIEVGYSLSRKRSEKELLYRSRIR
ncbi:DNA adenine methylase [Alsobacter metallidurans]|uniref:DNA adenine methylase n=1 Tax=Alsobacter metallidurans TaxID=340221 RepID=UPI001FCEC213|nr:DNA adenine methylase [Alsobacter metallidurans]